jgi:hypothetical protein
MFRHQGFEQLQPLGRQLAWLRQDLARPLLVGHDPGVHGLDQILLADEIHLDGKDAEQQIAVGVHGES